jgi:hypothetical protein
MSATDYDAGPYVDAQQAAAMLVHGVLDPVLALDPDHQRLRADVVIEKATIVTGLAEDMPDWEGWARGQIARDLSDPVLAQVIAAWIRRSYLAGQMSMLRPEQEK